MIIAEAVPVNGEENQKSTCIFMNGLMKQKNG
jgi:hypothetical protein